MARKYGAIIFALVLAGAILARYRDFLGAGKSLALAYYYDPTPRLCLYPWLVESARQLRSGHFPLWCDKEGAGMPLLANFQSAPLHPFSLMFELFPKVRLLDYLLLFRLFLLGLFTWLLAAELGLKPLSAGFAGLGLCFCGYVSRNVNHFFLFNEMWVPAGLLLAERMLKRGATRLRFLALSGTFALGLSVGNPQNALLMAMMVTSYALARGGLRRRRESTAVALALGAGVLFNAGPLLSFAEYLGYAWSYRGFNANALEGFSIRWLFCFFAPWLFGDSRAGAELHQFPGYAGLIPFLLAFAGLFRLCGVCRGARPSSGSGCWYLPG